MDFHRPYIRAGQKPACCSPTSGDLDINPAIGGQANPQHLINHTTHSFYEFTKYTMNPLPTAEVSKSPACAVDPAWRFA